MHSVDHHETRIYTICEVCKISCAGPQTYKEHLEGQKHKKKEIAVKQSAAASYRPGQKQLRCELCDVTCTGVDAYAAHIRGVKHQKTVKLHQRLGKPIPSADPVVLKEKFCISHYVNFSIIMHCHYWSIHSQQARRHYFERPHSCEKGSGHSQNQFSWWEHTQEYWGRVVEEKVVVAVGSTSSSGGNGAAAATTTTTTATTTTIPVSSLTTSASPIAAAVVTQPESGLTEEEHVNLMALCDKDVVPVGYEYIEEQRNDMGKTLQFNCKLCDCKFSDPNAKEMHLKGRRHRLQYKKKVDPQLEVDIKPSVRARRVQEERARRQMDKEEFWRRRDMEERMRGDADDGVGQLRWSGHAYGWHGHGWCWHGQWAPTRWLAQI